MFKAVKFGTRHAHRIVDAELRARALGTIPSDVLDRHPVPITDHNRDQVSLGDYKCSLLPRGRRALLTLFRHRGKKFCVLVSENDILLVSISISSAYSEKGLVLEGFLCKGVDTGVMTLQLTDTLVVNGTPLDGVPYEWRKLISHVFATIKIKPLETDSLVVEVTPDVEKADLGRLMRAQQRILLHPRIETFEQQRKTGSYLVLE
mgnify:CR=1 FL=1